MKIKIIGDGAFGSFLFRLLAPHLEISPWTAHTVILAVPFSAYNEVAERYKDKHLINVCSIQERSTNICLNYTKDVTSIHPLFGSRTPPEFYNSILTYKCSNSYEQEFLEIFGKISKISEMNIVEHDRIMGRTHVAAVRAAETLKPYIEFAKDIPDEHIPHSFRLLRQFVKSMSDAPKGTLESILANPYATPLPPHDPELINFLRTGVDRDLI